MPPSNKYPSKPRAVEGFLPVSERQVGARQAAGLKTNAKAEYDESTYLKKECYGVSLRRCAAANPGEYEKRAKGTSSCEDGNRKGID
ncbi:unnamed protein product [Soboliphyme baturini]|uniref:PSRT domain-containing protein n=1 Tax=Soboliphyme baturini TaxID=241478 RepID=A0A183J589_9BILA|nr:unnamed protein product [Soboliphyme baturini]